MAATLGIDLSSQPGDTAACLIEWGNGTPEIKNLEIDCDDIALDALIRIADIVAIDAPFGWPDAFRDAVQDWGQTDWDVPFRDKMRFRRTDEVVKAIKSPLSVSSDTIALPAMRAMCLLARHGITDKSGSGGKFYEVYPAASLKQWQLPFEGYKKNREDCKREREKIVKGLPQGLSGIPEDLADSDDKIDALVASLTARCIQMELTTKIPEADHEAAKTEGWIHVPDSKQSLHELLCESVLL